MNHYEHIDALHDIMHTAEKLGDIVNYFLDHLGEDHSFIVKGQSVKKHPVIEQLLQKSMESRVGKNAPVRLLLRHIQDKDFLHGTAQIGGKICMILFFEKSISGIMVFTSLATGETDIYRLRGTIIPQEGWR